MSFVAPSVVSGTSPRANGGAAILTCSECGGKRSKRSRSGLCFGCAMKARAPKQRYCSQCTKPITKFSKLGLCQRCCWDSPEFHQRRLEAIRKKCAEPAHHAKMAIVVARNHAKARLRPEFAEWLHNHGKELARLLQTPEVRAKTLSAETRAKIAKGISESRVGWCPPEFREEYKRLYKSKRMPAAKARAIIEEKIANLESLKDIDSALDYLRKFAPVAKLETGYRYGNAILSPSEIVNRATVRGWKPDRLAA